MAQQRPIRYVSEDGLIGFADKPTLEDSLKARKQLQIKLTAFSHVKIKEVENRNERVKHVRFKEDVKQNTGKASNQKTREF